MLFIDNEKFTLSEDEINQLKAVFPNFIKKNEPVRINYNDGSIKKIATNNPNQPWVYSKPTHGLPLSYNWIDDETGEQREIRYSDGPPTYMADGRKVFSKKTKVINNSLVFAAKDKEFLWFCYNFSKMFSNGKVGNTSSPYKFLMPEKEVTQKAFDVLKDARAKAALGSLNSEQLRKFATAASVAFNPDDVNEIILGNIFSRMEKNIQFREYVYDQLTPVKSDDISEMVDKAINSELMFSSIDGERTVVISNGKEVIIAEVPIDKKEALVEFISKDKKALKLLEKVIA